MTTDDGATKVPGELESFNECMERWKHSWKWLWDGPTKMSDTQRCATCGAERTVSKGGDAPSGGQ